MLEALEEFRAEERDPGINQPQPRERFADVVTRLRRMADPAFIVPGFVPQTVFWLVDGDSCVGRRSLRHRITCDRGNTGCRRINEANGGILEDEITIPGRSGVKRRYWITL